MPQNTNLSSLHLLHLRLVTGLLYDFASHLSQPRALTRMVMQVRPASITWRLEQVAHAPDNPVLTNPWAIAYLRLITPRICGVSRPNCECKSRDFHTRM